MEFSLHRRLKECYADQQADTEVILGRYRIDAVRPDGELVEIQFASLSAITRKVSQLLAAGERVCVVKPIVTRRRIVRLKCALGEVLSSRWSPKRGVILDLFQELVFFSKAKLLPHPRLRLEVPLVQTVEFRWPKKKPRPFRKDYRLQDIQLLSIDGTLSVQSIQDLARLVPLEKLPSVFTTEDLAEQSPCSRWLAQRIAYVLRHAGVIKCRGRNRQGNQFSLVSVPQQRSGDKGSRRIA
jgi:hypothetical protein